jgi:hypothetical protein
MVWMPSRLSRSARPDIVVTSLMQVDPAHGAHGAITPSGYSLIEERMRLNSGLSRLV